MVESKIEWDGRLATYNSFIELIIKKISRDKRHYNHVLSVLGFLATHGKATTWDIRKQCFPSIDPCKGETMARRIIVGRKDRGRLSEGLVGLGLVKRARTQRIIDGKSYQITLHGLLFSTLKNNYTAEEWYKIAENNKELIPWIFAKSEYLRKNKITFNLIRSIAKGDFARMDSMRSIALPYHELNDYLMFLSSGRLTIAAFAEFIALWFYTYQMYLFLTKNRSTVMEQWKDLIYGDAEIRNLYMPLIESAVKFYDNRHKVIDYLRI